MYLEKVVNEANTPIVKVSLIKEDHSVRFPIITIKNPNKNEPIMLSANVPMIGSPVQFTIPRSKKYRDKAPKAPPKAIPIKFISLPTKIYNHYY